MKEAGKMDKKGIVSMHAGVFFIIGLAIGAGLVYYLILKGFIPISLP